MPRADPLRSPYQPPPGVEPMHGFGRSPLLTDANGVLCDGRGRPLVHRQHATHERAPGRDAEVLGRRPQSPVDVLCALALDEGLPVDSRIRAASAAAPYTDYRMPVRVETATQAPGVSPEALASLTPDERRALLGLLRKLGA